MAFGPFTGSSNRGGVSQAKYGLAAMFQGLAQGLGEFAKMRQRSDIEDKRLGAESAREAANNAFRMNLERFHTQASADLQRELETGRNAREERQAGVQEQHWQQMAEHQKRQDENTERHQRTAEELQGRALDIQAENKKSLEADRKAQEELRKKQTEAANAAMTRGDAATALKIADDALQAPKYNFMKAQAEFDAVAKTHGPDDPEYKKAKQILDTDKAIYNQTNQQMAPLRAKALKDIGYGDAGASTDAPEKDPMAGARDAYAKTLIGGTLNGKTIDAAAAADIAAKAPPAVLQKFAPAAPQAKATTTDTGGGDFLAPTGEAAPQVAAATPPSTMAITPDAAVTPPPDATSPPPAAAAQTAQADPAAQYGQMAEQIKSDPESQGVITTLNRLAEAPQGPVADKMRRAAQIQLEQQFPDQDSNGFIDYYLDQNAQQPEIA